MIAKSIGAWMLLFLTILNDSPWYHSAKLFHIARIDSSIWTHKVLMNVYVGKHLIVAISWVQLPVESDDFMNASAETGETVEQQHLDASGQLVFFLD